MVDVDGLEVLDWVRKHAPETPVLLVTAFGNVDAPSMRSGAALTTTSPSPTT